MLGAEVIGVSLEPEQENGAFNSMHISSLCTDLRHDINDLSGIQKIFSEHQPEIVFHLAAQPLVLDSYKMPIETLQTNIMGTAYILETCRFTPSVKTIVIITTDKCYENIEQELGYKETDRLGGKDPYSASKAAAELVVSSYRESFFKHPPHVGLATVRAGNVIGGGDWAANRIVPDCIRSLREDKPIEVRNPKAVRPWQHVLEPLGGYLLLASKLMSEPQKYSEPWNFGPEEDSVKTVGELVDEVTKSWGIKSPDDSRWLSGRGNQSRQPAVYETSSINLPYRQAGQPIETKLLTLNISKAKAQLGWAPLLSFNQSIAQSVQWYKVQTRGNDMLEFSKNQIKEYQKLLKW
jgi:CDP-glucose 4,6-dehydratase